MFAKLRSWVFAVDPGEKHVGLAWTRACPTLMGGESVGSRYATATCEPTEAVDKFYLWAEAAMSAADPVLVIEEWRLYPEESSNMIGREMLTSENIGEFLFVARRHCIRVVKQKTDIKRPMAGILNGRGLKACGDSRHAKDAELHMWYFCLGKDLPGT